MNVNMGTFKQLALQLKWIFIHEETLHNLPSHKQSVEQTTPVPLDPKQFEVLR
jgi:hypothetical protein